MLRANFRVTTILSLLFTQLGMTPGKITIVLRTTRFPTDPAERWSIPVLSIVYDASTDASIYKF